LAFALVCYPWMLN